MLKKDDLCLTRFMEWLLLLHENKDKSIAISRIGMRNGYCPGYFETHKNYILSNGIVTMKKRGRTMDYQFTEKGERIITQLKNLKEVVKQC